MERRNTEIARIFGDKGGKDIRQRLIDRYIDDLKNESGVYIFGAKRIGKKIAQHYQGTNLRILAFVDNDSLITGNMIENIPVISLDAADKSATVIIASQYMYEISKQLKEADFTHIVPYPALSTFDSAFLADPPFEGAYDDLRNNQNKYIALYDQLVDEKSQETLLDLLSFRVTLDPQYLASAASSVGEEYFEDFVPLGDDEVFVDGGGYDGDTTAEFIRKTGGKYKRIHFFEPDGTLIARARRNLADYDNIEFYEYGLFSNKDILSFNATGGVDGHIDNTGVHTIHVDALDNIVEDTVTFLKLDVEGAEAEAIEGAAKRIRCDQPIIAVCVYHKAADLWQLPLKIASLNKDYAFYMRHYYATPYGTVVYCIPLRRS